MSISTMSTQKPNFYKLNTWRSVACGYNTNGYIFEKPPFPQVLEKSIKETRSNEDYAKFLVECDITDTRIKTNRRLYWKSIKDEIKVKKNLHFWGRVFGQEYADSLVDRYIEKHKILTPTEYPVWRKPVIKCVPAEFLLWEFDDNYRCMVCLNDDLLQNLARDCDILLFGNSIRDQFVVLKVRKPQFNVPLDNFKTKIPQIFGTPSKNFLAKNPDYLYRKFNLEPSHSSTLRGCSGEINLSSLFSASKCEYTLS